MNLVARAKPCTAVDRGVFVNIFLESLRDPIWQLGGAIIVLAALVVTLAVRSPDMDLSPQLKRRGTRIVLLACLSLFLLLSGGVVLRHGADASPTGVNESPLPSPSPTPS